MHQQGAGGARMAGQNGDRKRIDLEGGVGIAFGPVHRGAGGGIHDYVGWTGRQDRQQRVLIAQVDVAAAQRHYLSQGEQGAAQFPANLTVFAQQ
ncbi:hypothetical protein GCM10008164_22360 [Achromobacter xylosoxidans]|nr:hypothetical protein GCM10008164_22360 [Achromobacter xylosoxidans]